MSKKSLFCSLQAIAVLVLLLPFQAVAADSGQLPAQHYRAEPKSSTPPNLLGNGILAGTYYKYMANRAVTHRPNNFNFGALRYNYTGTPQYDPVGQRTQEAMLDLAYQIEHASGPAQKKQKMQEYAALVIDHLGNIDAVTLALSLARDNKDYGDVQFFEWARRGLLKDLLGSGDGSTMFQAYDLVTLGEAPVLMNLLQVNVRNTQTEHSGHLYYTMYEVDDGSRKPPYTIFADVTRPMTWLENKKQETGKTLNIRRQ